MEVENNAAMNQSSFSSLEENEKLFQAQPNTFGIAIESAALKELIDRDPDASTSSLSLSGQGVNLKSFNEVSFVDTHQLSYLWIGLTVLHQRQ